MFEVEGAHSTTVGCTVGGMMTISAQPQDFIYLVALILLLDRFCLNRRLLGRHAAR